MNNNTIGAFFFGLMMIGATSAMSDTEVRGSSALEVEVVSSVCMAIGSGNDCAVKAASIEGSFVGGDVSSRVFAGDVLAVSDGSSNHAEINMASMKGAVIGGNANIFVSVSSVSAIAEGSGNTATIDLAVIR